MKRITLFALVLLILVLPLCGCMNHGNVNHVHKTLGNSQIYTKSDIEAAMDTVIRHFRREFEGCTLLHLYYEEDPADNQARAAQYGADQGIVLLSSFEVGPEGSDGSLNPKSTYNRWSWILTRDHGGNWVLQSWGYG